MITIFNRKELCTSFSIEEQARVRDVLAANGIPYTYKIINRSMPSPAGYRTGRFGAYSPSQGLGHEYIFYVHKKDFEEAQYVLRK